MTHDGVAPGIRKPDRPPRAGRQIGTGFTFTEGPIWHPVDQYLLFSDMPADVRRRWDARGGVREVMRPSNKCNGMTYDADLNLIVCEHATSIVGAPAARRPARGARVAFRGPRAQQPERCLRPLRRLDLFLRSVVRPHADYGVERPRQLGFQGVFRVPPGGGAPQLLVNRYTVRSAERAVLLARRAPALRQRHGAGQYPRLRCEAATARSASAALSRAA